jgi:hypothetical protein
LKRFQTQLRTSKGERLAMLLAQHQRIETAAWSIRRCFWIVERTKLQPQCCETILRDSNLTVKSAMEHMGHVIMRRLQRGVRSLQRSSICQPQQGRVKTVCESLPGEGRVF